MCIAYNGGGAACPPGPTTLVINDQRDSAICYFPGAFDPSMFSESSGHLLNARKCPSPGSRRPLGSCFQTKANLAASLAVWPRLAVSGRVYSRSVCAFMQKVRASECARMFAAARNVLDRGCAHEHLSCLMPQHKGVTTECKFSVFLSSARRAGVPGLFIAQETFISHHEVYVYR